jgi:hypothetical protein
VQPFNAESPFHVPRRDRVGQEKVLSGTPRRPARLQARVPGRPRTDRVLDPPAPEELKMLLGLIGRAMKALARLRSGEARDDLDHVGDELVRLDRRPVQPPTTSR